MKKAYDYPLLHHNTFGIDIKCRCFAEYETEEELIEILSGLNADSTRWLHIGEGSNLLFIGDFNGTVLHSGIKGKTVVEETSDHVLVRVGAGENWDAFVEWCVDNNYYGAENLSLIPGEVGASAVQNIGAYGAEVHHLIHHIETIAVRDGKKIAFSHDGLDYGYRHSALKGELQGLYVVTHVIFKLSKQYIPNLSYRALAETLEAKGIQNPTAHELRDLIINIRREKLPEPKNLGSAGSFFMNPVVTEEKKNELLMSNPRMPHFEVSNGYKIPAGWLIEQCGWKGKRVGNAGVYPKQALVIVNYGGSTGTDIANIASAVQNDVKEKFGIAIHPEVNYIK